MQQPRQRRKRSEVRSAQTPMDLELDRQVNELMVSIIILIIIHHHHYHYLDGVLLNLGMERVLERHSLNVPLIMIIIVTIIIILIIIQHYHYQYLDYLDGVLLNLGTERVLERGGRPGPLLIPLIPIITRPRLKTNLDNFDADHGELARLIPDRFNIGESTLNQATLC